MQVGSAMGGGQSGECKQKVQVGVGVENVGRSARGKRFGDP